MQRQTYNFATAGCCSKLLALSRMGHASCDGCRPTCWGSHRLHKRPDMATPSARKDNGQAQGAPLSVGGA